MTVFAWAREEVLATRRDLLRIAGSGPRLTVHPSGTLREAAFRAAVRVEAV